MFARIRRLFGVESADAYAAGVAAILLREGINPADLDELSSAAAFERTGNLFRTVRESNLSPEDAAHAIKLAIGLYQKTRRAAAAQGWPLKQPPAAPDLPPHEAYFLELLREAVQSMRFRS